MTNQPPKATLPVSEADTNAILTQASKTGSITEAQFNAFITLMMAKEARVAEKEANLEKQYQAREAQRRQESERYTIDIIENQKRCKHLKGGKTRTKGQQRDPSVYGHTFTDGKVVIKCTLCKAKWMPKDTVEYLDRNGSKIPNWTRIGWREALAMAEDSSNRPSSSERFFKEDSGTVAPKDEKGELPANLQL